MQRAELSFLLRRELSLFISKLHVKRDSRYEPRNSSSSQRKKSRGKLIANREREGPFTLMRFLSRLSQAVQGRLERNRSEMKRILSILAPEGALTSLGPEDRGWGRDIKAGVIRPNAVSTLLQNEGEGGHS